ncbi:AAA family ATPase [Nocardia sp. NPDC052278]|uniref:AAA family ATPase n=1 Tax=unclassified Nocardia TaxID=2637762 RepID=UPI0036883633
MRLSVTGAPLQRRTASELCSERRKLMNSDDRSGGERAERKRLQMVVLRGLIGSGKSTLAASLAAASPNTGIVCRDTIREQVFHRQGLLEPAEEDAVSDLEMQQVIEFLDHGFHVIIDATHLKPEHVLRWKALAEARDVDFNLIDVITPEDICVANVQRRTASGGRPVPKHIIRATARQHPPETWDPPATIRYKPQIPVARRHRRPRRRQKAS